MKQGVGFLDGPRRRALEFSALIDNADDRVLRVFQEVLAEFNAQLSREP
jgi:hypothetical protein